jgi:hypothetical protein
MAQQDFTPHQQKIIKRYYDHRDALGLQRLAELVGELYLSSGKKRQRVWEQIAAALEKCGLKPERVAHLRAQDNPALLAEVVTDLQKKG